MNATVKNIEMLEKLYEGRSAFYGDFHNHSKSGGKSDGGVELSDWKKELSNLGMDFATIVDHCQVLHMYHKDWDKSVFIGGTEPGTIIKDAVAENKRIHYNMIFTDPKGLENLLNKFTEFNFEGKWDGFFTYPEFYRERFLELVQTVKDNGGFFVHPHPTQCMVAEDVLQYWFGNETGFEIFYMDLRGDESKANYELWCKILAKGKRIWATAGQDGHNHPSVDALLTVYAQERLNESYLANIKTGDMTCGGVGIKMCIGDTKMGANTSFEGKTLVVSAQNFHKSMINGHKYKLVVLNDKGIVDEKEINPEEKTYFEYSAENCDFYRAEVIDVTEDLRVAIGNPIWNLDSKNVDFN